MISDRYRVIAELGRGAMGRVYLVEHAFLRERLALKVLQAEFHRDERQVERLMREARAAIAVVHPNVIQMRDAQVLPDGRAFIVMEHLAGQNLADLLDQDGHVPWPRARHMVLQIADALAASHARGVVHRDLKPENCMRIERDGDPDFIKVVDFGIAKLPDAGAAKLTNHGDFIGTPLYASPEQVEAQEVDHRSDLWALGALTYHLLTGHPPFSGPSVAHVFKAIVFDEPKPIDIVAPDLELPAEVEAVLLRALRKPREERFQSAAEFAAAIRALPEALPKKVPEPAAEDAFALTVQADAKPPEPPRPEVQEPAMPGRIEVQEHATLDRPEVREVSPEPSSGLPTAAAPETATHGDAPARRWPWVLFAAPLVAVAVAFAALQSREPAAPDVPAEHTPPEPKQPPPTPTPEPAPPVSEPPVAPPQPVPPEPASDKPDVKRTTTKKTDAKRSEQKTDAKKTEPAKSEPASPGKPDPKPSADQLKDDLKQRRRRAEDKCFTEYHRPPLVEVDVVVDAGGKVDLVVKPPNERQPYVRCLEGMYEARTVSGPAGNYPDKLNAKN